jgi:WhiB family redox-sensing transcriptional regulator
MYTQINTEFGGVALREVPVRISAKRCADGNGTLTYLFFSDEYVDVQRAKAICAKCTSFAECLNGAIEREEPWGVWGGELIEYGRVVQDKKPRGRPATKIRPITVIEEVPIPAHLVA